MDGHYIAHGMRLGCNEQTAGNAIYNHLIAGEVIIYNYTLRELIDYCDSSASK